jgi:hypothetical protein
MNRRSEHLVEKRDGRTEFLRATKLARSVHLALHSVGVDEDWRALEVTATVIAGLRQKHAESAQHGYAKSMLTTLELFDAVQSVLIATGQAEAAVAYGTVSVERSRRRKGFDLAARGITTGGTKKCGITNEGPAMLPLHSEQLYSEKRQPRFSQD